MQTNTTWKMNLWRGISGGAGILCSMFPVMGCYPLVPAYVAAVSIEQQKNMWLYIGIAIGMARFMGLADVVKYMFVLILAVLGIRFYLWANRKIGGWAAGAIAAVATMAMNISGMLLLMPDRNELAAACSESIMVLGLTVLFHYLIVFLPEFLFRFGDAPQMQTAVLPQDTDARMEAFAAAFGGLSDTFTSLSRPKNAVQGDEVGLLQREITGKMCASCDGCALCWNNNTFSPAENIRRMLSAVVAHKTKEEIVQQEYITDCPNYPGMVEEAVNAFSRLELNRAWYARLMENRIMIAQQLDAMADMMGEWVRGNECVDTRYRIQLARMQLEVKERGLIVNNAHVFQGENGHLYIRAEVAARWGGGIPVRNYMKAVSGAMGRKFRGGKDTRALITSDPVSILLYEENTFYVLSGIASKKKDQSVVSGDNFSMLSMDDGQYVVALSDGMGSGAEASQESEMVVELLDKFLEAGFRKETAIKMMNSAMVLQGENNKFSTLDLASVDLYSGKLELSKIGAAATFIKHKDGVEWIASSSLPAGAACEPELEQTERMLENGDFLVMVTDGVVEYLHVKEPEETLSGIIEEITTENAGVLAKTIMDRVMLFTGGHAKDDMTILVTGFWKK